MSNSSKTNCFEEAIRRAAAAGWQPGRQYRKSDWRIVITTPDFWRYLGKHEHWIDVSYQQSFGKVSLNRPRGIVKRQDWKRKMIACMQHIANELSIDSYFKYLLK